MKQTPNNIPAVSVGAAVAVEWVDGKIVLTIDLDTVAEGLRELVSIGDLTEDQEDFLSVELCKGNVGLVF